MASNVYECMFIFNANAYNRNQTGAAKGIADMVESVEGELLASRLFDERKLSYPINGHRKGVYWLTYIKMESEKVGKLNRASQLNDLVLRHLFVKIDPRLAGDMVAVAQGKTPEAAPEPDESKEAEPAAEPAEATAES